MTAPIAGRSKGGGVVEPREFTEGVTRGLMLRMHDDLEALARRQKRQDEYTSLILLLFLAYIIFGR